MESSYILLSKEVLAALVIIVDKFQKNGHAAESAKRRTLTYLDHSPTSKRPLVFTWRQFTDVPTTKCDMVL